MKPITELVKDLADKHGRDRRNLLPILQGVVEQEKYLSEYSMFEIARELDLPVTEVYGTATFYSFLECKKMGKYIIRVCKTITCSMKGERQILLAIQDMLKIKSEKRHRTENSPSWRQIAWDFVIKPLPCSLIMRYIQNSHPKRSGKF